MLGSNDHTAARTKDQVDKRKEIDPTTSQMNESSRDPTTSSDERERKQMSAYVDFVDGQAEKASNQLKAEIEKEMSGGKEH